MLKDQRSALEEISTILSTRYFNLLRLLWSLEDFRVPTDINIEKRENIINLYKNYYDSLRIENIQRFKFRSEIKLIFGNDAQSLFFSAEDELICIDNYINISPKALIGYFVKAHYKVTKIYRCVTIDQCIDVNYQNDVQFAKESVKDLEAKLSEFIVAISEIVYSSKKY